LHKFVIQHLTESKKQFAPEEQSLVTPLPDIVFFLEIIKKYKPKKNKK
jgi:hypothetical protein